MPLPARRPCLPALRSTSRYWQMPPVHLKWSLTQQSEFCVQGFCAGTQQRAPLPSSKHDASSLPGLPQHLSVTNHFSAKGKQSPPAPSSHLYRAGQDATVGSGTATSITATGVPPPQ
jgi:hypothetical protein